MPHHPSVSEEFPPKPRFFEMRMAALFAAVILPGGFLLPFLPLWLEHVGISPEEIGVILAAQMFLRLATTPFFSALADTRPDRAPMFILTVGGAFVFSLGYLLPPTFLLVLAVSLLLAVLQPLHTTLTDSLAVSGVRRYRSDYARMRIWGSVAYLVSNIAGGLFLAHWGAGFLPWVYAASMALALGVALALTPRLGRPRKLHGPDPAGGVALLRNRYFVFTILAYASLQASHAFVYGFGSIYWRAIGISETAIGWLWAVGTLAEVILFAVFPRFFGRLSPDRVLVMAGCAALFRWLTLPLIEPAGLSLAGFVVSQSLHAFSTGMIIIALQATIARSVPDHLTSGAQGLAFFAQTLALGIATLVSGALYQSFGAQGFWAMAVLAGAGLGFALAARRYPQSSGAGGNTSEPS
ncbi:MAG: MFS transporter [Mesorhizobium amorphae]|nr:MAG: MFS transporter [Mesorhizobium amorphae]